MGIAAVSEGCDLIVSLSVCLRALRASAFRFYPSLTTLPSSGNMSPSRWVKPSPHKARLTGIEPVTFRLEGGCSIQLSYRRIIDLQGLTTNRLKGKAPLTTCFDYQGPNPLHLSALLRNIPPMKGEWLSVAENLVKHANGVYYLRAKVGGKQIRVIYIDAMAAAAIAYPALKSPDSALSVDWKAGIYNTWLEKPPGVGGRGSGVGRRGSGVGGRGSGGGRREAGGGRREAGVLGSLAHYRKTGGPRCACGLPLRVGGKLHRLAAR